MDIGSVLLGLALLVLVAFIVARPLLERDNAAEGAAGPADQLLIDRERVLTQLRDLDFDRDTGKINPSDYSSQRAQLVAEGVAILKQLDSLGLAAAAPAPGRTTGEGGSVAPADEIEAAVARLRGHKAGARPAGQRAADDEIEARIAERRATPAKKLACAQCGAAVLPGDRFCPKCGSPLTVTCVKCGTAGRAGDPFCGNCGEPLPAAARPSSQARVQG